MLLPDAYEYVCESSDNVPEKAYVRFPREIGAALGEPVHVVIPELAKAFPLTVAAMEAHWPRPVAVFDRVIGTWLWYLVLVRNDLNLFFSFHIFGTPIDGPDYELAHSMLPPRWRELYRRLDSFLITDDSVVPIGWRKTPFPYSARLTLEEYRQQIGGKKSATREFEKRIGSDRLMCWLWTESGDALFLDEKRCDQKVYHVKGMAFSDMTVLEQPEDILDRYLAHIVSGQSANDFLFRN